MGTAIKHPVPDRVKPSFVIFDIRALWRSVPSARVPGCQKLQMTVWHRMLYSCTHMATVCFKGFNITGVILSTELIIIAYTWPAWLGHGILSQQHQQHQYEDRDEWWWTETVWCDDGRRTLIVQTQFLWLTLYKLKNCVWTSVSWLHDYTLMLFQLRHHNSTCRSTLSNVFTVTSMIINAPTVVKAPLDCNTIV